MKLQLDPDELRPLVKAVVLEVLDQLGGNGDGDRIAYSEAEAASLLGVEPHVLRDCRRRREITAVKVGKSYRYSRAELLRFLGDGPRRNHP